MKRDLWSRTAFASLGYLAAVAIAVLAAISVMLVPTVLPNEGAQAPFFGDVGYLGEAFQLGLVITLPTALPGFLATLLIARKRGWVSWFPFACAGALNALLALAIFSVFVQPSLLKMAPELLLSSLLGGLCGGCVYWAVVRRLLADRAESASS